MSLFGAVAALAAGTCCRECGSFGSLLCEGCALLQSAARSDGTLPGVDRVLARWAYEGIPRDLILDLKLKGVRTAAGPLAAGLAGLVRSRGLRADVLTWVPGRTSDTRVRGFDHAELIARHLSARLGLSAAPILIRRRDTEDQTSLSATARRKNLTGVFEASSSPLGIAIVDDVVTTGATAEACARALRKAGARHIELIAACRA